MWIVVERSQRDDDPDEIMGVWAFSSEEKLHELLVSKSEQKKKAAADVEGWRKIREDDSRKSAKRQPSIFDEYVAPHLYRPTESEARERYEQKMRQLCVEAGYPATLDDVSWPGLIDVMVVEWDSPDGGVHRDEQMLRELGLEI